MNKVGDRVGASESTKDVLSVLVFLLAATLWTIKMFFGSLP